MQSWSTLPRRANTATDPAPTEMFETIINLKPESEWRPGMTTDKLIAELDQALQFPGVANSWTMPIKARIDMLSTGIRTPIGIKVFGKDLNEMERLALRALADQNFTVLGKSDDRRSRTITFRIFNNLWLSTFEYRYAAICCSEVDSDCSSHF